VDKKDKNPPQHRTGGYIKRQKDNCPPTAGVGKKDKKPPTTGVGKKDKNNSPHHRGGGYIKLYKTI